MRTLGVVTSGPCIDVGDIVDELATGTYVFNKPAMAFLGTPLKLVLVLKTSEAQDVSSNFKGLPGVVTEREGKFAQTLEATLRGADHCDFGYSSSTARVILVSFLKPFGPAIPCRLSSRSPRRE